MVATTLGTICHNDDKANDADHRRVEVWVDAAGVIWADRQNPQSARATIATSIDDAVQIAAQVWGGPGWDFRISDDLLA